jgi:glycosyltransferase involved in cell wall biosynthesis
MSVAHIITGLDLGGAEYVLYRLIENSRHLVQHQVFSLTNLGVFGARLQALDVPVNAMGLSRNPLSIARLARLRSALQANRPDVVQSWMYHADLLGGIVARSAVRAPVIWGIRNSDLDPDTTALTTRVIARLCAAISQRLPSRIISCSHRAARLHIDLGYRPDVMAVIPNGVDIHAFAPSESMRVRWRDRLGLKDTDFVFGHVGRWDPQKDHQTLLRAFAIARRSDRSLRCVLVGSSVNDANRDLVAMLEHAGVREACQLLGPSDEVNNIMSAFDALVMSSAYGEAFPNVVAEALACAIPAVVTDVGDASDIVGPHGWTVPKRDPTALGAAMQQAVVAIRNAGRSSIGAECRAYALERFSMQAMVRQYVHTWRQAADETAHHRARD